MSRMIFAIGVALAFSGPTFGFDQVLISEDFETGMDGWTTAVYGSGPTNDAPLWFDASGASTGDPIYGPNINHPGSHAAGFSSNLTPWDGSQPQWLDKRWVDAVAPGTYDVTLTLDRYTYIANTGDYHGLGNRTYILTDGLYNNPFLLYDNNPFPPPGNEGDGIRSTRWQGDGNGAWEIQKVITGQLITATGDIELRLMMHEKYAGQQTVAWDNLSLVIRDPAQGNAIVFSFSDDFEAGLDEWTPMNWKTGTPSNDTPQIFSYNDALLYVNANNNGTSSAGFSSNLPSYDGTRAAWMMMQLPAAVAPGTYQYRLEFDRYVSRGDTPNNTPIEIPASGAGLNGSNAGFNGTKAVGYSSNLGALDVTPAQWIQVQFPNTGLTGTLSATVDVDMYIYKQDPSANSIYNRLYVLTGDKYDNPTWTYTDNASPGWRKSYSNSNFNNVWQHITWVQDVTVAADGNIELRLLCEDKKPGLQSVAWDNVSLVVRDPAQGNAIVFSFSDDFEDGLAGWTAKSYMQDDRWPVGNRVYLLTDDQYDDPAWEFDVGSVSPGLALSYWPGDSNWDFNGAWRHETIEGELITTTGDVELRLLQHDKNSGPQATAWDNVVLTLLLPCNPVRFDADGDLDVDQEDFGAFQACYTGDGGTLDPQQCRCMKSDTDTDIDAVDYAAFAACASGPQIAYAATCDDGLSPP